MPSEETGPNRIICSKISNASSCGNWKKVFLVCLALLYTALYQNYLPNIKLMHLTKLLIKERGNKFRLNLRNLRVGSRVIAARIKIPTAQTANYMEQFLPTVYIHNQYNLLVSVFVDSEKPDQAAAQKPSTNKYGVYSYKYKYR